MKLYFKLIDNYKILEQIITDDIEKIKLIDTATFKKTDTNTFSGLPYLLTKRNAECSRQSLQLFIEMSNSFIIGKCLHQFMAISNAPIDKERKKLANLSSNLLTKNSDFTFDSYKNIHEIEYLDAPIFENSTLNYNEIEFIKIETKKINLDIANNEKIKEIQSRILYFASTEDTSTSEFCKFISFNSNIFYLDVPV